MLHITRVMINCYNLSDIDFMGYTMNRDNASFHHLIIPKRNGGTKTKSNGAILNKDTSHPYLHVIETKDYEIFYRITKEMIKENRFGKLDLEKIKKIYDLLEYFEREHCGELNILGEPIIKKEFTIRPLSK